MNRAELIKKHQSQKNWLNLKLTNEKNYKGNKKKILRDAFRFLELEKEIQIQEAYLELEK